MPHCITAPSTQQITAESLERDRALRDSLPRTYTVLKVWSVARQRWEAAKPERPASDGIIANGARRTTDADPTPAPGTPLCELTVCGNVATLALDGDIPEDCTYWCEFDGDASMRALRDDER
jgi:hypothetical protein